MGKPGINGNRTLSVPSWSISLLKFLGPVVTTLALAWARLIVVESHVSDLGLRQREAETKQSATDTVMQAMDRRLNTVEVKQQVLEKDLQGSLSRIEATIHEVRSDVKDLQKSYSVKP